MSDRSRPPEAATEPPAAQAGLDGWVEAGFFTLAISVLNLTYGLGHAWGAHPVAFMCIAMPVAAVSLLALTGPGPDWRAILTHPLSWAVGSGIIGMEAAYYVLLAWVTPADASLLVRLTIPVGLVLAFLFAGRRPKRLGVIGALIVLAGIAGYLTAMQPDARLAGMILAGGCALIMSSRNFAAEFHPWNRAARTVSDKMRVTGLVLLMTSATGIAIVAGAMVLGAAGVLPPTPALPTLASFMHLPTIGLAVFCGAVVLTAMQYLGFSTVVKIKTENFLAVQAFTPLTTLALQSAVVAAGLLPPQHQSPPFLVAVGVVIAGVMLVIWSGRR